MLIFCLNGQDHAHIYHIRTSKVFKSNFLSRNLVIELSSSLTTPLSIRALTSWENWEKKSIFYIDNQYLYRKVLNI